MLISKYWNSIHSHLVPLKFLHKTQPIFAAEKTIHWQKSHQTKKFFLSTMCLVLKLFYEWSEQKIILLRVCVFVVSFVVFCVLLCYFFIRSPSTDDDDCLTCIISDTEPYVLFAKSIVMCIRCVSTTFIYRCWACRRVRAHNCHEVGCAQCRQCMTYRLFGIRRGRNTIWFRRKSSKISLLTASVFYC